MHATGLSLLKLFRLNQLSYLIHLGGKFAAIGAFTNKLARPVIGVYLRGLISYFGSVK